MLTNNHKIAQLIGLSLLASIAFAQDNKAQSITANMKTAQQTESFKTTHNLNKATYQTQHDLANHVMPVTLLKPLNTSRWQRHKSYNIQSADSHLINQHDVGLEGGKVEYTWNNTASVNAAFYQLSIRDNNAGEDIVYEESRFALGADYGQFSQAGFHAGLAVSQTAITDVDLQHNSLEAKALALQLSYGIDDKLTFYSIYHVAEDEASRAFTSIDNNEGQAVSLGAWYSWTPNIGGYLEAKVDESKSEQSTAEQFKEGLILGLRINL